MSVRSSDILEQQFGPTRLSVLRQDDSGRIIITRTEPDGRVLEVSSVAFRPEGIAAFPDVHRTVVRGASMGKAFGGAGIPFIRDVRVSSRHGAPAVFSKYFGSTQPALVTNVLITVGRDSTPYADILEVYHPAVRPWELIDSKLPSDTLARLEAFARRLGE